MNKVQKRVVKVLERLIIQASEDAKDAESMGSAMDVMLDDLHQDGFFGTEGQGDPRGDFREGQWSIDQDMVQGIDEQDVVSEDNDENDDDYFD